MGALRRDFNSLTLSTAQRGAFFYDAKMKANSRDKSAYIKKHWVLAKYILERSSSSTEPPLAQQDVVSTAIDFDSSKRV